MKLPNYFTVPMFLERKGKKPIVMVTAYDAVQARLVEEAGVDSILIGDSVGMTTLGYDSTLPVTMDVILHHTKAVVRGQQNRGDSEPTASDRERGTRHALIIADMPFGSYGASIEEGVRNGVRLISEGGAQAVKLEGAGTIIQETVRRLTEIGVPVMGHLGMTPQSVHLFGGFRMQGKAEAAANRILADCHALVEAGVFGFVLELIPPELAQRITEAIPVPTIGIGAGENCDGQVQVLHDLIGWTPGAVLKHAKRYVTLGETMTEAVNHFAEEVRSGQFTTGS